ncbi:MAG: gliding motility-associated C-terminal domain-containing protein [Bacteroidota bacterium]
MNNLDKILKEQMEQFAPEAPNVWAGIETGIKNNAGSSNAGSGNAAAGSKIGMGILKMLAIASLPAAFIAYSYLANPNTNNSQAVVTTQQEIKEQQELVSQPPLLVEPAEKEIATNKTIPNNNNTNKANKKPAIVKELANNNNNAEALNNQTDNHIQNQEINANPINTKTEAKPKTDNPQILQSELNDESNLNEEIESSKKEEEVEKPKEEIGKVTLKNLQNVITPNNDGLNDKYLVDIEGEKYYNLKIYNTQNELVFESSDKLNNWDGTNFKTGQACAMGTYYGILIYKGADNADLKTLKTAIQLIR